MNPTHLDLAMTVAHSPDETFVTLRADTATPAEELARQVAEIIAVGPSRVTLDLSDVSHVASLGLGVILALRRAVVGYGGEVRLGAAHPAILELFRRTHLDVLFPLETQAGRRVTARSGTSA